MDADADAQVGAGVDMDLVQRVVLQTTVGMTRPHAGLAHRNGKSALSFGASLSSLQCILVAGTAQHTR